VVEMTTKTQEMQHKILQDACDWLWKRKVVENEEKLKDLLLMKKPYRYAVRGKLQGLRSNYVIFDDQEGMANIQTTTTATNWQTPAGKAVLEKMRRRSNENKLKNLLLGKGIRGIISGVRATRIVVDNAEIRALNDDMENLKEFKQECN